MRVEIAQVRPDHPDAVGLIGDLDAHLEPLYPAASRHGFSVARLLEQGVDFFVLRVDGVPAACGGMLVVGPAGSVPATDDHGAQEEAAYGEIKRMFVRPAFRGTGLGRRLLEHLASHARARGVTIVRLETGIHQLAAIRLYEGAGFRRIAPFGPYTDDPVSRCFELRLA